MPRGANDAEGSAPNSWKILRKKSQKRLIRIPEKLLMAAPLTKTLERTFVGAEYAIDHGVDRKSCGNPRAQPPCGLGSRVRGIAAVHERRSHGPSVLARNQPNIERPVNFRNAANPGGDQRQSRRGSFQNDVRQGLGTRWDHHDAPKALRLTRRHGG